MGDKYNKNMFIGVMGSKRPEGDLSSSDHLTIGSKRSEEDLSSSDPLTMGSKRSEGDLFSSDGQ